MTAPDWSWDSRRNAWEGWLLWYVAEGNGTITYPGPGGAEYLVQAGSCCLFRMSDHFEGVANQALAIHAVGFVGGPVGDLWPGLRRHRRMRQGRLLQDCIDRCVDAQQHRHEEAAQLWLRSSLDLVAGEDAQPRLAGRERERADAVAALAQAIEDHPAQPWTSADTVAHLGVSREQAARLFKKYQGFAPGDWVMRCRFERAKHMLRFSTAQVREIACAVGYNDPYYFSRIFKKHCGMSPKHWRSQPWEEDAGNQPLPAQ